MLSRSLFSACLTAYSILFSFSHTPRAAASAITTCVVPSSNGKADDTPAVQAAFAKCSSNAIVSFSEGVNYNIFTPVIASNLSNVTISMQGNLHLPQNIAAIQSAMSFLFDFSSCPVLECTNACDKGYRQCHNRRHKRHVTVLVHFPRYINQLRWDKQRHKWLDLLLRPSLVGCEPSQWHWYCRSTTFDEFQRYEGDHAALQIS